MSAAPDIHAAVIQKTRRVPLPEGTAGDGAAAARQLDVAMMAVGFKCSPELLAGLSARHPVDVASTGQAVLRAVRQLVGDHVQHNAYFKDFPANVPDTEEFWAQCVGDALLDHRSNLNVRQQLVRGAINLLDLPRYGRYQHSYEEMRARHASLIASAKDRVTVLQLGGPLAAESYALYLQLAESPIPLHEDDLVLLGGLAAVHVADPQPDEIPMRENRAVVNAARVADGLAPTVDTVTDVLRLACALSDGDVTLSTPTKLRSLRRAERRLLLAALDDVVTANPAKLADVRRHTEPFKRLGERLHPHDYPRFAAAADVFAVARGERTVRTLAGRVELALADGDVDGAIVLLATAPGALLRAVDQLTRCGADPEALVTAVAAAARTAAPRVVLQLREHLLNRATQDSAPANARIFVNQEGRAWTTPDARPPLPPSLVTALSNVLDEAFAARLPQGNPVVVDPQARAVALPLTGKARPDGLGLLPRGSASPVDGHVRFFVYWKQRAERTDYDLSALLLDDDYRPAGRVDFTRLSEPGAVHSGDIVEAPNGASEFIELTLAAVQARYVMPQVNIFAGEGFDAVEEAFFGFMQRDPAQQGAPYEPRTVRAKSDLYGAARVQLPLVFVRADDGSWSAKWMHLALRGHPNFNQVKAHLVSASMLARGVVERDYLTLGWIEGLLRARGATVADHSTELDPSVPVTYLGSHAPDALPSGSTVLTPSTFWDVID